jgi:3-oxoacyl-[acyl-carrier-protein] synthase-3
MSPVVIRGTGSAVAGVRQETEALIRQALPEGDVAVLRERIGIATRYWVAPEERAAALGATALGRALEMAGCDARDLERIVFVSSTGGDWLIPATANDVAALAGCDDTCDAFDVNNSCAGFITAFDLAARSVATGLGLVAVVVAETFSRYLTPEEPRPYLVLGDAAGAVILGRDRGRERAQKKAGVLGTWLRNSSRLREQMMTPHPGRSGRPEPIRFGTSSAALLASALEAVQKSTDALLSQAELTWADVDWFLPHQPNGEMLAQLVARLPVKAEQTVPIVGEVGSVGAASIPFSLDRLLRTRQVRPGELILMAGFGSGTAYGAALYQVVA